MSVGASSAHDHSAASGEAGPRSLPRRAGRYPLLPRLNHPTLEARPTHGHAARRCPARSVASPIWTSCSGPSAWSLSATGPAWRRNPSRQSRSRSRTRRRSPRQFSVQLSTRSTTRAPTAIALAWSCSRLAWARPGSPPSTPTGRSLLACCSWHIATTSSGRLSERSGVRDPAHVSASSMVRRRTRAPTSCSLQCRP